LSKHSKHILMLYATHTKIPILPNKVGMVNFAMLYIHIYGYKLLRQLGLSCNFTAALYFDTPSYGQKAVYSTISTITKHDNLHSLKMDIIHHHT